MKNKQRVKEKNERCVERERERERETETGGGGERERNIDA
jgi:hypothetical protein